MGGLDRHKPAMAMAGLQFIYAGLNLFTRAAFLQGLSPKVFVVYRLGIATLVMAPIAYLSRRRDPSRSPLEIRSFTWMFVASLIGVTANQWAYFEGIDLSSATMASTMTNLIPAITFIMAFIAGWEKVNVRNLGSIAKILGTVVCVTGAISMVLLKGPKLLNTGFIPQIKSVLLSSGDDDTWLLGSLLLFGSSWFWSSWIIVQVPISETCPDHTFSTAWVCFLATIQSVSIALALEQTTGAWKLHSFLQWGCCLYGGIAQALTFFVQSWCISKKGPVYCAMFNPLCTVIVTILAALFLNEKIYIGSLMGACAVIIGLYIVLWGKAKDVKEIREGTDPLMLQNDQTCRVVQVSVEESNSEKKSCNDHLEEPLLSDKSIV
ncbi:hypothetical protein ACOSP7_012650 [Xanthoceras sorbifolium]